MNRRFFVETLYSIMGLKKAEPSLNVAILLCTYNGGKYIKEQVDSYFCQTHSKWELFVSDDGSSDNTIETIKGFQGRGKNIHFYQGPKAGFGSNFFSLLRRDLFETTIFAFSDQDDIWLEDKIERAVEYLITVPSTIPAMYCGRTVLVNENNQRIGLSTIYRHEWSFQDLLIQSPSSGNTMVLNQAARDLLLSCNTDGILYHDWFAAMAIAAVGGIIHFDVNPCLRYRQHASNVIGMNDKLIAKSKRYLSYFGGGLHQRNAANIRGLLSIKNRLTDDSLQRLNDFSAAADEQNPWMRWHLLRRSGVGRNSTLDTMALWFITMLRKYP